MASADVADKKKEINSLEVTESVLNISSRPKRKLKPRNYSDEFYIFGNPGSRFAATSFLPHTSTPVSKSINTVKRRPRKLAAESIRADNIVDSSLDTEISSQIDQGNETLETEINSFECDVKQTSIKAFTSASDTKEHDGLAITDSIMLYKSTDNERLNAADEILNNSNVNLTMLEKKKSTQVDISVPKKQQSRNTKSKNKFQSTLEDTESSVKSRGRKRKRLDHTSLTEKVDDIHDNENTEQKDNKHDNINLEMSTKVSKRRKINSSCGVSDTNKNEASELNHHHSKNSMLPDKVDAESVNHFKNIKKAFAQVPLSADTDIIKETIGSDVTYVAQKRHRGRPPKSNITPLTQLLQISSSDTSAAPALQEIQIDDHPEAASKSTQKEESSVTSVTPLVQKRSRGRPSKTVPQEKHIGESGSDLISQDIHIGSLSDTNVKCEIGEIQMAQPFEINVPQMRQPFEINVPQMRQPFEMNALFVPQKRPRGRPPKTVPQEKHIGESGSDLIAQDIHIGSLFDTIVKCEIGEIQMAQPFEMNVPQMRQPFEMNARFVPQKRQRGRPPKSAQQRNFVNAGEPSPVVSQVLEDETSVLTCRHCGKQMNKLNILQLHMMSAHSLIWAWECPQGYDDPPVIVRRMGHIDCQKCNKRFRNAQYYRHHQIWCGREDELATCEICKHKVKAMWLQQHVTAHKTQEKKKSLVAELKEKQKGLDPLEQDDDSENQTDKKKRKAAKNAIKLMSSLQDRTQEEAASSSDGYAEENSGKSSDDEHDSEEDDDEGKERAKKTPKKCIPSEKKTDSSTIESTVNNIWIRLCNTRPDLPLNKKLQILYEFYARQSRERIFPDLSPRKIDWDSLVESEKQKYIPVSQTSSKFTFGLTKDKKEQNEEHSLKFGHTLSHDGKAYCYTGGPVWALEWCPMPEGADHEQCLAISADRTTEGPPDTALITESPGLIQIWSAGLLENKVSCHAEPVLQYVIAHDSGYVRSISWCPQGCFDADVVDSGFLKRLGLLAVAGSDGRVVIYSAPQPEELKQQTASEEKDDTCRVFRPKPALVLIPNSREGCGPCLSVSWQQGGDFKYIVAGYGRGTIYLWDVSTSSPLLKVDSNTVRPLRSFTFHKMAVLSCCWSPGNPAMFVTVSYDFNMCVWNAERSDQPVGIIKRLHLQQVPRSVCWAGPVHNGFFSTCDKFVRCELTSVCFHGLSKAALQDNSMSITVQNHMSCTWDVSFCPFFELLATCDATGSVKVSLLPMTTIRCLSSRKKSSCRTKALTADLYHAKLSTRVLSPSAQPQSFSAEGNSDNLQMSAESFQPTPCNKSHSRNMPFRLENNCQEHVNDMNGNATVDMTSDVNEIGSALITDIPLSNSGNSNVQNVDNTTVTSSKKSDNLIMVANHNEADNLISVTRNDETDKLLSVTSHKKTVMSVTSNNETDKPLSVTNHKKTDNLISVTSNNEDDNNVDSVIDSSNNSNMDTDESSHVVTFDLASDNILESDRNHFITPSASSARSAINNTSPAEDSRMSRKDPELETISKSCITSSKNNLLEFSKTCFDGLKDSSSNDLESKLGTHSSEAGSDEVLHYHDCGTKNGLKHPKSLASVKPELEVFGGSNTHAIHRVHFNPNPECCLWLASGGQSGIVRLDNLTSLVHPPPFKFWKTKK